MRFLFLAATFKAFHLYEEFLDWYIDSFEGERYHSSACRFVGEKVFFFIPIAVIFRFL